MLHVKIVLPFLCREKVIKGKSNKAFGMIKVAGERWEIHCGKGLLRRKLEK
jgi:hypothetical protein